MAIVQRHQNLLEDVGSLLLIEKLSCNDPVEKLATSAKSISVEICVAVYYRLTL